MLHVIWLSITVAAVMLAYRWAWRVGHEWGYVDGFNDSVRNEDLLQIAARHPAPQEWYDEA